MNRKFTGAIVILAVVLVLPLQGYAATPMETVETGVNEVIAKLSEPGFKSQAKDVQISQLSDLINTIFDFE